MSGDIDIVAESAAYLMYIMSSKASFEPLFADYPSFRDETVSLLLCGHPSFSQCVENNEPKAV